MDATKPNELIGFGAMDVINSHKLSVRKKTVTPAAHTRLFGWAISQFKRFGSWWRDSETGPKSIGIDL